MQKIIPHLWYGGNAEEAVKFYRTVFKNSKILRTARRPKGSAVTVSFTLNGKEFLALNGAPRRKSGPAASFLVDCKTQKEVDYYWRRLSEGGKEVRCGWLEDKFGMSWQIVPTVMSRMIGDRDPAKVDRVVRAMLEMRKLDIKKMTDAYEGARAAPIY